MDSSEKLCYYIFKTYQSMLNYDLALHLVSNLNNTTIILAFQILITS